MKSKLKFTIPGQPVPYTRTTQRAKFVNRQYQRYRSYQDWVREVFRLTCEGDWGEGKPLTTSKDTKTRVDIMIYFGKGKRGDTDNIYKGVVDALFKQDIGVMGSKDFDFDKENPRVEVEIS